MSRGCTICRHAAAAAINGEIHSGRPIRQIAAEYGLSYPAAFRHATNHVDRSGGPTPAPGRPSHAAAAASRPPTDAPAPPDPLSELADALRPRALAGADPAASREYRLALAALEARSSGASAPAFDIAHEPQWIELRTLLFDTLQPFPDAWAAMRGALWARERKEAGR